MACKLIAYIPGKNSFHFGGEELTVDELGAKMAQTLLAQKNEIDFGPVTLTIDYLTAMLRFTAHYHRFWDSFDLCTGDHEFNKNKPTPGANWAQVQALRSEAAHMREYCRGARVAHVDCEFEKQRAADLEREAHELLLNL